MKKNKKYNIQYNSTYLYSTHLHFGGVRKRLFPFIDIDLLCTQHKKYVLIFIERNKKHVLFIFLLLI
jgi:hypothetical protein